MIAIGIGIGIGISIGIDGRFRCRNRNRNRRRLRRPEMKAPEFARSAPESRLRNRFSHRASRALPGTFFVGRKREPGTRRSRPSPRLLIRTRAPRLHRACRARHCAESTIRQRGAIHTMAMPGSLGKRAHRSSPRSEAGRRRSIGGVAALPVSHSRPRRWCDAGPLGRQSVTAAQKAGLERTLRWFDDAAIHSVS